MGGLGMRVRLRGVLVSRGVIALPVMLGRRTMRLCSRLVMFGSLRMIGLGHDSSGNFAAFTDGI